ncbi:nitrate- and nitrite sensing domain-containing protein [Kitasatospora sp. NBC_00374]|uniref:sensor histidine kinase n=1 Tax=Kitasatospora sp. NBC_00374 TaxID=2975964 RepID=UPI0030DEFB02
MRVRRGTPRSAPTASPSAPRGPVRPGAGGHRRGAHAGPPAREDQRPEPPAPGPRRALPLRPRTVRAKILALLMVPVVSVIALWSFATVTTAQNVADLRRTQSLDRALRIPAEATVAALQAERSAAGQLSALPGLARESALREAAATTDRAAAPLTLAPGYNRADAEGLGPETAGRVDALTAAVAGLADLRAGLLARTAGWADAYAAYGAAVDRALEVTGAVAALQGHRAGSDARVLLELAHSHELLAREDALLRTGQAAGRLTEEQFREYGATAHARRLFEQTAARDLRPGDRAALQAVTDGPDHRDLTRYEDAVRTAADGRAAVAAVAPERWVLAADGVARGLGAVRSGAGAAAVERSDPYAVGLFTPAGAAVLLGLIAVVASLLISVQIGRGLVTELIGLRNSALELAGRQLPSTMRRLRAGEEIDVEAEAPLRPHGEDEIGQVHGALGSVRRAAVTAAVERAEVLSGVSGVFVNLARRSQVLVHRQLTLLDAMERRTEDPAELDDLFRLDHLTTRMRRHAEGLIILSGAAPGRAWRRPVPLVDVVRAAVAEVEDYARVEVHRLPFAAVTGPAVADLTHLVAELVENATGFSPPHTKVHIRGEQVGNGYALEIEDRGLGMGPEALADANRRIAATEQVDLFDSDRLGLFVVSRLARRHEVRVALRPSAYGGTTAVVLLPTALLETPEPDGPPPRSSLPPARRPVEQGPVERQPVEQRPVAEQPVGPPATAVPFGARGADPGVLRPTPFRRAVDRPEWGAPAPAPAPAPAARPRPLVALGPPEASPAPPPAAEEDELPRRVRQASLAPQLREAPPRPRPRPRSAGPAPAGRHPDEVRAAMSAYQQGWARGSAAPAPVTEPARPTGPEGERR